MVVDALLPMMMILRTTLIVLIWSLGGAGAVWINLPKTGSTKCVSEEIQANVVVLATYLALYDEDHSQNPIDTTATISTKVTSPYGNVLHHEENVTRGQFAFTSTESGTYLACFWLDGVRREAVATVSLNWRMGIAAKDWDSVAKKQKVEGIELELMKLEEVADEIYDNLMNLRVREAEMRDVSETTNFRVALFSIMSLAVCISVSFFQLWHLKAYFQKKKLI